MTGGGQQRSDQVHLECDSITIVVIIVLASSTKIIMISLSSLTSIMFFAHLIVQSYFQESCLLFLVVIPTDFLQIIHPDYKSFQNFELQE